MVHVPLPWLPEGRWFLRCVWWFYDRKTCGSIYRIAAVAALGFLDQINGCGHANLCQVKGGSYFGVPGRMNLPESWILLESLPNKWKNICNAQEVAFDRPFGCQVSSIIFQGSSRRWRKGTLISSHLEWEDKTMLDSGSDSLAVWTCLNMTWPMNNIELIVPKQTTRFASFACSYM